MICVAVLTCGHKIPLDDPDQDISVGEWCPDCKRWCAVEHVHDAEQDSLR